MKSLLLTILPGDIGGEPQALSLPEVEGSIVPVEGDKLLPPHRTLWGQDNLWKYQHVCVCVCAYVCVCVSVSVCRHSNIHISSHTAVLPESGS